MYKWPSVSMTDEFQYLILPKMSCEDVIVVVLQNTYVEIICQQHVNFPSLSRSLNMSNDWYFVR